MLKMEPPTRLHRVLVEELEEELEEVLFEELKLVEVDELVEERVVVEELEDELVELELLEEELLDVLVKVAGHPKFGLLLSNWL